MECVTPEGDATIARRVYQLMTPSSSRVTAKPRACAHRAPRPRRYDHLQCTGEGLKPVIPQPLPYTEAELSDPLVSIIDNERTPEVREAPDLPTLAKCQSRMVLPPASSEQPDSRLIFFLRRYKHFARWSNTIASITASVCPHSDGNLAIRGIFISRLNPSKGSMHNTSTSFRGPTRKHRRLPSWGPARTLPAHHANLNEGSLSLTAPRHFIVSSLGDARALQW